MAATANNCRSKDRLTSPLFPLSSNLCDLVLLSGHTKLHLPLVLAAAASPRLAHLLQGQQDHEHVCLIIPKYCHHTLAALSDLLTTGGTYSLNLRHKVELEEMCNLLGFGRFPRRQQGAVKKSVDVAAPTEADPKMLDVEVRPIVSDQVMTLSNNNIADPSSRHAPSLCLISTSLQQKEEPLHPPITSTLGTDDHKEPEVSSQELADVSLPDRELSENTPDKVKSQASGPVVNPIQQDRGGQEEPVSRSGPVNQLADSSQSIHLRNQPPIPTTQAFPTSEEQTKVYQEELHKDHGKYPERKGGIIEQKMTMERIKDHSQKFSECILKANENGLTVFKCVLCGTTSSRRVTVANHVENIHFPGSYPSNYCDQVFNSRNTKHGHLRRILKGTVDTPLVTGTGNVVKSKRSSLRAAAAAANKQFKKQNMAVSSEHQQCGMDGKKFVSFTERGKVVTSIKPPTIMMAKKRGLKVPVEMKKPLVSCVRSQPAWPGRNKPKNSIYLNLRQPNPVLKVKASKYVCIKSSNSKMSVVSEPPYKSRDRKEFSPPHSVSPRNSRHIDDDILHANPVEADAIPPHPVTQLDQTFSTLLVDQITGLDIDTIMVEYGIGCHEEANGSNDNEKDQNDVDGTDLDKFINTALTQNPTSGRWVCKYCNKTDKNYSRIKKHATENHFHAFTPNTTSPNSKRIKPDLSSNNNTDLTTTAPKLDPKPMSSPVPPLLCPICAKPFHCSVKAKFQLKMHLTKVHFLQQLSSKYPGIGITLK